MVRRADGARLLLYEPTREGARTIVALSNARASLSFSGQVGWHFPRLAQAELADPILTNHRSMRYRKFPFVFSLMMGVVAGTSACSNGGQQPVPGAVDTAPAPPPPIVPVVVTPQERQLYLDAARTSWNLVNRITEPSTGLARAHAKYSYVTLWDIAGAIAANYTAHELAFIDDATYDAHIQRILATLSTVDLFDKKAYNRIYDAKTGRMVDNASKISNLGAGWSSVDIGRLLVWLRIVSTKQPKYMPLATQVVRRLNMSKLLDDGFLRGLEV